MWQVMKAPCGVPVGERIGSVKRNDDGLKPSLEIERSVPAGAVPPQARHPFRMLDQVNALVGGPARPPRTWASWRGYSPCAVYRGRTPVTGSSTSVAMGHSR